MRFNSVRNFFTPVLTITFLGGAGLATSYAQSSKQQPDLVEGGNRWHITAFKDASPFHDQMATQGICFKFIGVVGTHLRYMWYSDTFPDWNGIASQEGDQIKMHGDYFKDIGHDGMQWEIVSASKRNRGYGHWTEWREDGDFGSTIVFANTELVRTGDCRISREEADQREIPRDEEGRLLTPIGLPVKDDIIVK